MLLPLYNYNCMQVPKPLNMSRTDLQQVADMKLFKTLFKY